MKMHMITDINLKENLINLAHERFDLDKIFKRDDTTVGNAQYLLDQSWFVTFCSDSDEIYALLILEWLEKRKASLHFCMFNRGNILKGWKLFLNEYGKSFDELMTYIPLDRLDVLKLSKALGFKHTKEKDYYYGKFTLIAESTAKAGAAATTSCTSNHGGYQR